VQTDGPPAGMYWPHVLQRYTTEFGRLPPHPTKSREGHRLTLSSPAELPCFPFTNGFCHPRTWLSYEPSVCCILISTASCLVRRRECDQIAVLRTEVGNITSSTCPLLPVTLPEHQRDPIRCRSALHVAMGVVPASGPHIVSWWCQLYSFCVYIREGGTEFLLKTL
jgi:hypothetical protein